MDKEEKPDWYNEEMEKFWSGVIPGEELRICELMKGKRICFNPYRYYFHRKICRVYFMNGHDANSASDALKIPNGTVTDLFNEWLGEYI